MTGDYPNEKINRLLASCTGFTLADFADLSVAAADQAGMSVKAQRILSDELDDAVREKKWSSERGGYVPGDGPSGDRL